MKKKSYPVLPNAVYVWRGFKAAPPKTYTDFAGFLGNVFVPACALLQPKVGLRAYLPTMVPQKNKPVAVPDQTALMFWATPESHNQANETLAVRMYQNLHGDVYDMVKSKLPEIPQPLPKTANAFKAEQPYYLFENKADWMLGKVLHVVGARPQAQPQADFLKAIYNWAASFQKKPPKQIDAALVCCGNDYAVVWVHANGTVRNFTTLLSDFEKLVQTQLAVQPKNLEIKADLWSNWPGINLLDASNASLNIQLNRPLKTTPVKPQ